MRFQELFVFPPSRFLFENTANNRSGYPTGSSIPFLVDPPGMHLPVHPLESRLGSAPLLQDVSTLVWGPAMDSVSSEDPWPC